MPDWMWVVVAGVIGIFAWGYHHSKRPDKLCTACGTIAQPDFKSTASPGIGLFMWIGGLVLALFVHWIFILLPVGHLIARAASKDLEVCPKCASPQVVPLDTPIAQKLLKDLKNPEK
jgi:hypothetical protein